MLMLKILLACALMCMSGCVLHDATELQNSSAATFSPALVVTHDISNTFDHVPPPSADQLQAWATAIAATGGKIAFGLVGDPDSTGHLVRGSFMPLPSLPKYPTFTDETEYTNAYDSITRENQLRVATFVQSCLTLLGRHKNHKHTHLNGRFSDVATYFQEPGMERFQPVYFCISDGFQDVRMSTLTDTDLHPEIIPTHVKVMTCGWKNPVHPANWVRMESPEALTSVLYSLTPK
jgi:hypothetical protein